MKQSEILIDHEYTNSDLFVTQVVERKVLDIFKDPYNGKKYVTYKITYANGEVGLIENLRFHILLKSFARWAKKDVT